MKNEPKKLSDDKNGSPNNNNNINKINKRLKVVLALQLIFIIILVLNFLLVYIDFTSSGAIIDAGDDIELDLSSVEDNVSIYDVKIELKNTGDATARVSVTGDVYISEMGSAFGEEVTSILEYKYIEISPGETKDLNLGTFNEFENWHYVVKVYISWNGGSLELGKLLIPQS